MKKTLIILSVLVCTSCGILKKNSATYDKGVVINGVRWATRNVDKPNTFALTPQDLGMFYHWNSKIGWSATDPITSSDTTVWRRSDFANYKATDWETDNDPCPCGWRLPTCSELESLVQLRSQVKDNGLLIARKLFLPAAGYRNVGWKKGEIGRNGYYWNSEMDKRPPEYNRSKNTRTLRFTSDTKWINRGGKPIFMGYEHYPGNALNVRCVKNESDKK